MRLKKKVKKSQVSIYVAFIFTAIIIIVITAVLAPMGVLFNAEMYVAGEELMLQGNETIAKIQNDEVRNSILAIMDSAFAAQENNIAINADMFRYSWIFILGLTALVVFLFTRRLVETSGGSGGFI